MNAGIIQKALREGWAITALCGTGLMAFEALVAWIFYNYQEELSAEILRIEFVRQFIESLIGSQLGDALDPAALRSLAWIHPLVLAVLWAHVVTFCTRVPAGEIDRATADILFSLPVSRWRVYLSESFVWLMLGAVVIAMTYIGNFLGHLTVPVEDRPDPVRSVGVALNFYCLYFAVGGLALLASAFADRRGRAIGVTVGILLVQFVWNFLGQYWQFADDYSWLTILDYYSPMAILVQGAVPLTDMAVLAALGLILWTAGGLTLARRDICTV